MAEQVTCWGTALPPSTVDMSRRMGTPSPLPPNSLKYHRKQISCGQTSLSCQQAIGFVKKSRHKSVHDFEDDDNDDMHIYIDNTTSDISISVSKGEDK